ncbi:MAG: hypothetical protein WCL56_03375 [Sediminibacterium sp.]|jgi:CcmD family protein
MNKFQKISLVFIGCLMQIIANAQTKVTAPPATDFMRSNGKIYLVMTIVVVIMTGLLLYVISIDRKISQLEKK